MKEEYVGDLVEGLKLAGIGLVAGLPDSWLRNALDRIRQEPEFKFVPVGNEGVGYSICAGAWCGGMRSALLMENSGLRVAAESIARMSLYSGIPVLLVTSYRGDIGETEYWAYSIGATFEPMLKSLRIPYVIVRAPSELRKTVVRAATLAYSSLYPVAVVVSGDLIW